MITINIAGHGCCEKLQAFVIKVLTNKKLKFCWVVEGGPGTDKNRHFHALVSGDKKIRQCLQGMILTRVKKGDFPYINGEKHGNIKMGLKVNAWYKDGRLDGNEEGIQSGLEYLQKEEGQVVTYSENFGTWEEIQDELTPHKPLEERTKNKWHAMIHWRDLFAAHGLPTKTRDQIAVGLSTLCFVRKVGSMPNYRDVKQLVTYLWMWINEIALDVSKVMEDVDLQSERSKKRRRMDMEAEDHMQPEYMSKRDKKEHEAMRDELNATVS